MSNAIHKCALGHYHLMINIINVIFKSVLFIIAR